MSEPVIPFAILNRYLDMLRENYDYYHTGPVCNTTDPTHPNHLAWMLNELAMMEDREKAMRWLGFVQGVIISNGLTTVDAERDFTRPYFKKD